MRNRNRRARAQINHLLESLESRQLLAADFSAAFRTVPAAALSNSRQNVTLTVTNSGDTKFLGNLSMTFYAQLDGSAFDVNVAKRLCAVARAASIGAGER